MDRRADAPRLLARSSFRKLSGKQWVDSQDTALIGRTTARSLVEGNPPEQFRPARFGALDDEVPVELVGSVMQVAEPETALARTVSVHSATVVDDQQLEMALDHVEAHHGLAGLGMASDVGYGLSDDDQGMLTNEVRNGVVDRAGKGRVDVEPDDRLQLPQQ